MTCPDADTIDTHSTRPAMVDGFAPIARGAECQLER